MFSSFAYPCKLYDPKTMQPLDQSYCERTIGYVGFIDRESGAFRALFNVTGPRDDHPNNYWPVGFQVLEDNPILETHHTNYPMRGPHQNEVHKSEVWTPYIKHNSPAWISYANLIGLRDVQLVVVRGWFKPSAWALAVGCRENAARNVISRSGDFARGDVSGPSPLHRVESMDKQSTLARDQCTFLSFYRVAHRLVWLSDKKRVWDLNLPPRDEEGWGDGPIQTEDAEARNPLNDVVKYIFSSTKAEYAIVSDADLDELCDGAQLPPNFPAYLKSLNPRCEVIGDAAYLSITASISRSHENCGPIHQPMVMQGAQGLYGAPQGPPGQQGNAPNEQAAVQRHALLFQKNGVLAAVGYENGCVNVWNVKTGQVVHQLQGHDGPVYCTVFSPDGRTLVSGSLDCALVMWDMDSGDEKMRLEGHEGDVWSAAFSPDGSGLATGSGDTTVRFWSVATGETYAIGEGHDSTVEDLLFVPDGTLVVSCADVICRAWHSRDGTEASVMEGHTGDIRSLSCSHDGSKIATGAEDHTIRIWRPHTGDQLLTISSHTGPVCSVLFSLDDRNVISVSNDASIGIHDTFTGDLYFTLREHIMLYRMVPVYDDGSLKLWDATNSTKITESRGYAGKIKTVMFSPDEDNVVTLSEDGTVRVWSMVDLMKVY